MPSIDYSLVAHPDLRVERFDGRFEVTVGAASKPLARAERLSDRAWVAIAYGHEGPRAVVVASELEAAARLRPWCRMQAWRARPNAGPFGRGGKHAGSESAALSSGALHALADGFGASCLRPGEPPE